MCGLFSVFNSNAGAPKALEGYVRDSFIAGSTRGADSTGVFNITKANRMVTYHKMPVNGTLFAQDKATQYFIDAADFKAITVGHNRKATAGGITMHNAHPFITTPDAAGDYIIGVHNGGFPDWRTRTGGTDYDVDSEWAFNHLFKNGLNAFKDFNGAYAMIWYDTRTPNVINVARNKDRSLYYQWLGDGKKDAEGKEGRGGTIVMASEHGQLAWLAARNNLTMGEKIYIIEEGHHYTFNIDDVTSFTKALLPVKEVAVLPPVMVLPHERAHGWHGNRSSANNDWSRSCNNAKDTIIKAVKEALQTKPEDEKALAEATVAGIDLVTADEIALAKKDQEFAEEFVFIPESWDSVRREILGTINYDFGHGHYDSMDAVFRGVNEQLAMEMLNDKYAAITGRCIGLYADSRNVQTFVLHTPKLKLKSVPLAAGGTTH